MIEYIEITDSKSPLSFEAPKSSDGTSWHRELCINQKSIFSYGPNCETCQFFIEQCNSVDSSITINEIRQVLNTDVSDIPKNLIDSIKTILPNNIYGISFRDIKPTVFSNHEYQLSKELTLYELCKKDITKMVNESKNDNEKDKYKELIFHEYILPIQKNTFLNDQTIKSYEKLLTEQKTPCAIAISVLEIHGRDHWYDIFLLHFLLDGHHKMQAAANIHSSIKLLSFIKCDEEFNVLPFIINRWKQKTNIDPVKQSINYIFDNVL